MRPKPQMTPWHPRTLRTSDRIHLTRHNRKHAILHTLCSAIFPKADFRKPEFIDSPCGRCNQKQPFYKALFPEEDIMDKPNKVTLTVAWPIRVSGFAIIPGLVLHRPIDTAQDQLLKAETNRQAVWVWLQTAGWNITHEPTGMSLLKAKTKLKAQEVAKAFLDVEGVKDIDWTVRLPSIDPGTRERINVLQKVWS